MAEENTPETNSAGFASRYVNFKGKQYLLFMQEASLANPEGSVFGVFISPVKQPNPKPLDSRLQGTETDEEMWQWAEQVARSHAEI